MDCKIQLIKKLEKEYDDYIKVLTTMYKKDIITLADFIATMQTVLDYVRSNNIDYSTVQYFLFIKNPLMVITNYLKSELSTVYSIYYDEMESALWDISDSELCDNDDKDDVS